jgi:hypothetical protein
VLHIATVYIARRLTQDGLAHTLLEEGRVWKTVEKVDLGRPGARRNPSARSAASTRSDIVAHSPPMQKPVEVCGNLATVTA